MDNLSHQTFCKLMTQSSTKLRFTESLLRRPKNEEVRALNIWKELSICSNGKIYAAGSQSV